MTDKTRHKTHRFGLSVVALAIVSMVAGCAGIGDTEVSLLPRTALKDPLEVPPGISPLPEPEQFVLPGQPDAESGDVTSFSPEQLRSYSIWLDFEEFKKYQAEFRGEGLTEEEFQYAKLSGEGIFRVSVVEDAEEDTIHLETHDNADAVWAMLPSILADMTVFILEIKNKDRVILVRNTGADESWSLLERLRLRKYTGGIDQVQVHSIGENKTKIVGLTDLDVAVDREAGREFFSRLRFYLLARYEVEQEFRTRTAQSLSEKQLIEGDDGVQRIVINQRFENAWVRVGRTLQGAGAGIQDMNRSEGVYYVSFSESPQKRKKKRRWKFWQRKKVNVPQQEEYRIFVSAQGDQTEISVVYAGDKTTEDYDPGSAQKILLIIYERLTV